MGNRIRLSARAEHSDDMSCWELEASVVEDEKLFCLELHLFENWGV